MTMIISGSDGLEFPDGSDQTSAFTGNASSITSGILSVAYGGTGLDSVGTSGNVLTSNGTAWVSSAPASGGKILQVLTNSTIGDSSTTSTSYVDMTNATVTITPSSASSKILVIASGNMFASIVSGVNVIAYSRLLRNSTALQEQLGSAQSGSGGLQGYFPTSFCWLDSPATTSAVTYKLQQRVNNASSTMNASQFKIIVQEVAA